MYCIIKCIVQGKQARVKKRKSASPVLNVLNLKNVIFQERQKHVYCQITISYDNVW